MQDSFNEKSIVTHRKNALQAVFPFQNISQTFIYEILNNACHLLSIWTAVTF